MSRPRRRARSVRGAGARRGRAVLGILVWALVVLGSLALVVWRQTQGLALDRGLRELETQHGLVEAERVALERQIQTLSSRARVVRVAREQLGMHLPAENEIVFLPMPGRLAQPADTLLVARGTR